MNRNIGRIGLAFILLMVFRDGPRPADAGPPLKESSLEGVTQNWDQVLPSGKRFTILESLQNQAVRDNETGLVWEKSPAVNIEDWHNAGETCINKNIGGRKGWRLPSIPELSSLIDPGVAAPGPTLPVGHPFSNIQPSFYWSATTFADLPNNAWRANFQNGTVTAGLKDSPVSLWCVRGGMNANAY